ncbi:MAG: hypothetical protein GX235_10910 [Clostridiales bacterium]|nr:hypothetical protein [Clostridiales bacterium]
MKENQSNELIERYLYDVIRRLPEKQREDIEQELRTLIEDMIEERAESGEYSREECERYVLNELGNPVKLAKSYRGGEDSLISGEYYDEYCFILKIILICAGVGIIVSNIASTVIHAVDAEVITNGTWREMFDVGISLPAVLLQIFGTITLIFAIMQRYNVKINVEEEEWSVEKLPQIPYKKAIISRGESAVGIVFGILVILLFTYRPQLMGAWIKRGDSIVSIPLFNLPIWGKVLPFFIISVTAGIISDFVKLVAGRYNYRVMITTIVMDILGFVMTFIFIKMFPIWNENFIPELQRETERVISAKGDILTYFNTDTFANGILLLILFCFLLDIGTTVYYTVRYGNK